MKRLSISFGIVILLVAQVWADSYVVVPFDYPGAQNTWIRGINDSNQILINAVFANQQSSFLKTGDTYSPITVPNSNSTMAFGINNSGQIVGLYSTPTGSYGFIKNSSGYSKLEPYSVITPSSYSFYFPYSINNLGTILGDMQVYNPAVNNALISCQGYTKNGNNAPAIFSYKNNNYIAPYTHASSINDSGQVVGMYLTSVPTISSNAVPHSFLKTGDNFSEIKITGSNFTIASNINNKGQIVGSYKNSDGSSHGFIKTGDIITNIDIKGAINISIFDINNNGVIVGNYQSSDGKTHGFMAQPSQQVLTRYDFTHYYNNGSGDYYTGYVYGDIGKYQKDQIIYDLDENNCKGYYKINQVATAASTAAQNKEVFITKYYDLESKTSYSGTQLVKGTYTPNYLGSEVYYIIKNVPEYRFGAGASNSRQYEADFNFAFPIKGYRPYSVPTSAILDFSVFDSSTKDFYLKDGIVKAFDGEIGKYNGKAYNGNSAIMGYQNNSSNPTIFLQDILNYNDKYLWYDGHSGYDYAISNGTAILAPAYGKLYKADKNNADPVDGQGSLTNRKASPWDAYHTFYIDHGNGIYTWYLHCQNLSVTVPTGGYVEVYRGQPIAVSGQYSTPFSVGPHLHYEVRKGGVGDVNITDPYKDKLWEVYDKYTFKYSYNNGDYYSGWFYAKPDSPQNPYYMGWQKELKSGGSVVGHYEITGASYEGVTSTNYGKVYVNQYYDGDKSKKLYDISTATPLGTKGLQSEYGYIIRSNIETYRFGGGLKEADGGYNKRYDFQYTYLNGDYYTGQIFADDFYLSDYLNTKNDENGKIGTYKLSTPYALGNDNSKMGQVLVSKYWDMESKKSYDTLSKGLTVVGNQFLGSESDYITTSCLPATAKADFKFGDGLLNNQRVDYEADVISLYSFKYSYGPAKDWYNVQVYAPAGTYGATYSKAGVNEQGTAQTLTYNKLSEVPGYDLSYNGTLKVSEYFDAERGATGKSYSVISLPISTALGTERGYIYLNNRSECFFGFYNGKFYEADAGNYGKYLFTYNYNDGSGDYYKGSVFHKEDLMSEGQKLEKTAAPLRNDVIKGYYLIDDYQGLEGFNDTGVGLNKMFISSYYDGQTKRASQVLNYEKSKTPVGTIIIANRGIQNESGYVYDPLVPKTDAYFGHNDVTYFFSANTDGNKLNFLQAYITDLPYWNQPSKYPGSCAEVASAIILSYWDRHGYADLIPSNWPIEWKDNTKDAPASYVDFITTLCNEMKYVPKSWWKIFWGQGTTDYTNFETGILSYIHSRGYTFQEKVPATFTKASGWSYLQSVLLSGNLGRPLLLGIQGKSVATDKEAWGHMVVARGYWQDGRVVANFGWGTTTTNLTLDWKRTDIGIGASQAFITAMFDIAPVLTY